MIRIREEMGSLRVRYSWWATSIRARSTNPLGSLAKSELIGGKGGRDTIRGKGGLDLTFADRTGRCAPGP